MFFPTVHHTIVYIIPSCVATSIAGFSAPNFTYAFFLPAIMNVLTLTTLTLNRASTAFFTSAFVAFLSTTKSSLFSVSIVLKVLSVLTGYFTTLCKSITITHLNKQLLLIQTLNCSFSKQCKSYGRCARRKQVRVKPVNNSHFNANYVSCRPCKAAVSC